MLDQHFPDCHYTSLKARERRQLARLDALEPVLALIRHRVPNRQHTRHLEGVQRQQRRLRRRHPVPTYAGWLVAS